MSIGLLLLAVLALAQAPSEDVDVFMEKVLARRDVNWADYRNYFCNERAVLELEGTLASAPIQGTEREYLWFVRDDVMVRSPISVDGVAVSPEDREKAERDWIERAKKREEKRGTDRERFLGFRFEPGNYFFAGRDVVEGRDVVVVEYYPEHAFADDDEEEEMDDEEREIVSKLNKVLLVTLWIDPQEHQIVRMSLDNAGFDFLPGKWLVQLDTIEATLTMHQPFAPMADVWLAKDIRALGRITTAAGDLGLSYTSTFENCIQANTSTTFSFPEPDEPDGKDKKAKKKKR